MAQSWKICSILLEFEHNASAGVWITFQCSSLMCGFIHSYSSDSASCSKTANTIYTPQKTNMALENNYHVVIASNKYILIHLGISSQSC